MNETKGHPLLEVRGLRKTFRVGRGLLGGGDELRAVDGVSFSIPKGRTLGLVGESGCGKSTTARLILRLVEPSEGSILLDGEDITRVGRRRLLRLRREMQMVFQDPLSSLNPRMTVGVNVAEPLRFHRLGSRSEQLEKAVEMLEVVGLRASDFHRYPHEFSGGQCQRVAIARALVLRPTLVVFDEPVSALDVSIRAQILKLILDLQQQFELTYVFISHDLSVVKRICDFTAVMYLGRIVEHATSTSLYRDPQHPYTRALLEAIPLAGPRARRIEDFVTLSGDLPSPSSPPTGCAFHTRCPVRVATCSEQEPSLVTVDVDHQAACILLEHERVPRQI